MYELVSRQVQTWPEEERWTPPEHSLGYSSLGVNPLSPQRVRVEMRPEPEAAPFRLYYLTFPHIEVPHAFSTRWGGVSVGPYRGLNIGLTTDDSLAAVEANRARFTAASGLPLTPVLAMVHGVEVVRVDGHGDGLILGDACITDKPGQSMMITTADCVPIIFYDPQRPAVGLAHAGWRGTVERIAKATVEAMQRQFGSDPAQLRVGVGPSIGPCSFEVGEDVAAKFTCAFSGSLWGQEIVLQDGKGQGRGCTVDLWLANLIALYEAGVKAENICLSRLCSACRDDYFYSYRRDRQVTGRMAAAVLLPQKS